MINNRQGGRRRGRGGQRPQNLGGRPDGNRQDNRQRGNAAQLLEKYKSMARDAQLSGDRVQSEYYLQFADHYFRVLGESRARFDEQRRQRGDDSDEDEGDEEMAEAGDDQRSDDDSGDDRRRQPRERPDRKRRSARDDRDDRPQRNGAERPNGGDERIAFEALPPPIGRDEEDASDVPASEEDEAPRPRRRARRPRAGDEGEVAPVA